MENREQQILSEIKSMMGTIRAQLELLDAKMVELQQCVDPDDFDNNPIEVDIDLAVDPIEEPMPVVQVTEAEPLIHEADEPAVPEADDDLPEAEPDVEPVDEPESDDDDLPGVFDQVVSVNESASAAPVMVTTVAEAMADKHAWRSDMPGSTVKDVRSAISLNDRIIFINHLFDEDPLAFQNTITRINTLNSLDEVVDFVTAEHPEWDLSSELVYRFMMAVRRRVK